MADVSSSDLLWDHSGEDLEDNPLINTYRSDTPVTHRVRGHHGHGTVQLSYYQTTKLLENLEESSETLRQHLEDLHDNSQENDDILDVPANDATSRQRICQKCRQLLHNISGTITIIFTILLQGINLIVQTIIDIWSRKDDNNAVTASCVIMIIVQLLNLILIIFSSVKLARQLYKRKVNGILLVQSYFAVILLFAGLYTVTSRMKPGSWKDIRENVEENPGLIIMLYTKFLYFSVSTATLCGTASTMPYEWYNYIFVSLQMLLSFMYFASILGHALTPFTGEMSKHRPVQTLSTRNRIHPRAVSPSGRATPLPSNYGAIEER